MRSTTVALALLALVAGGSAQPPKPGAKHGATIGGGFIRASGNKFVDDSCGDFIPIGWNCEWGVEGVWWEGGGGAGGGRPITATRPRRRPWRAEAGAAAPVAALRAPRLS